MNRTITLIFLLYSTICSGQSLIPDVLYYKFDGTGTDIPNLAKNPSATIDTAVIVGSSLSQGGSGKCGGALTGSGATTSTDYVNTKWVPNLGNSSWTISFWTSSIPPSSTLWYIFGDVNTSSFRCFTNGVAGADNWIIRGGGITDVLLPKGAVAAGCLNTFVYDSAAKVIRAYLNDSLVNSVTQTGSPNISGSGPFTVGATTSGTNGLNGLLDEFRIYRRALTKSEIGLIYKPKSRDTITVEVCKSFKLPGSKKTFNKSGTYLDTIPSLTCGDSVVTINLTIKKVSSNSISATTCYSYTTPSGKNTWINSGTYKEVFVNYLGCDSVITYYLTINKASRDTVYPVVCNSYLMPAGKRTVTQSGIYNDTVKNSYGCDSIITVDLIVNKPTYHTLNINTCNGYTSPSGKLVITNSGIYKDTLPNFQGCDSIITINATILKSTSSNINVASCYSYTSPSKKNTWKVSGVYNDKIKNAAGCDSLITINLTILTSTVGSISPVVCGPYQLPSGKRIVSTSGNYNDTIKNAAGCDSIMFISLTINSVNTGVVQSGTTLTASASNAGYQWFDCSNQSIINGAINRSYTATANGSYGVYVTENNCTDTSLCYAVNSVSTKNNFNYTKDFTLLPNPTNGIVNIKFNEEQKGVVVSLFNSAGQLLETKSFASAKSVYYSIDYIPGMYFLRINTGTINGTLVKILKQ